MLMRPDTDTFVFANARIVTAKAVFPGYVAVSGGKIVEIGPGRAPERGLDCAGDLLLPGLVELHTDHLETHFQPRPKVEWPALPAVLAHDAQIAASGITTVLDALRAGNELEAGQLGARMKTLAAAIAEAKAGGLTRAEHFLHLRCEIACPDVLEEMEAFLDNPELKVVSVMDHTPGQRQFTDISKWKTYYGGKRGMSTGELDRLVALLQERHARYSKTNRRAVVSRCRKADIALASHDDATNDHVIEAIQDGVAIAEFPVTFSAAEASHVAGMKVLMGAPNVVRGGSHSGNVSARALAEAGLLDILSSDYVPGSLLMAALTLADVPAIGGLAGAIRLVTKNPAEAAGLRDRGEIAAGKRADLLRVSLAGGQPVVRAVYRQGERVA